MKKSLNKLISIAILLLYSFGAFCFNNQHDKNIDLITKIAQMRLELTRLSSRSFEEIPINNLYRTVSIISVLLDRAEQKILDVLPEDKYEWSGRNAFEEPTRIIEQAASFMEILSSGQDPFEGRFSEPGGYVVDHALIEKDGVHHLFYIRGPAASAWPEFPTRNFGHAVSTDLIHWQIKEPILQSSEGKWDSFQVWAPHIIAHQGKYFMFYAGVNDNATQAIGLAISDDLYKWERYGNGPLITTGEWGVWSPDQWSDCRDPMIFKDGKTFYCYYTAFRNTEFGKGEYCIGISSSSDLFNWKDEGFIRMENSLETPPESPFVLKKDGKYYLFYTSYQYGTVYSISDNPIKGWEQIPGDKASILPHVSASEVYYSEDKWYITLISHMNNGLHFFEIHELFWNGEKPSPNFLSITNTFENVN